MYYQCLNTNTHVLKNSYNSDFMTVFYPRNLGKEHRLKEGQLGLFLVTWAIVSPPRVWC